MADLSATIRLRPTRVALLVRPSDLSSIRTFMRLAACMWGGTHNPIIPIFRSAPKEWRSDVDSNLTGVAIAKGYIEFFEPDAYVEAQPDLLEEIGLGALRDKYIGRNRVIPLAELMKQQDHQDWSELQIGLGVNDALKHLHETEQRFELRDKRPACVVKPRRGDALVEAIFGAYPTDKPSSYIFKMYRDVFKPQQLEASAKTWQKVFQSGYRTPLSVTRHKLEAERFWYHEPVFYVFDPLKSTDLIDLWNIRIEPNP